MSHKYHCATLLRQGFEARSALPHSFITCYDEGMAYIDLDQFKAENGYDVNGYWYPRVTSIVSIKAKPALYRFYADQKNFAAAEAMKNKSAEEGTLIHEVIEALMADKPITIPDVVRPVVTAFHDFRNQHDIVPHQIEQKILSKKHGYAGTIDVLAEVDGRLGVLDIKTSYAIYRDYGIQTAAYVEALHETPSMPRLARWILRLDQARTCLKGCGAKMREKGGTIKVRNGMNRRAYSCDHTWGELVGEVELRELQNLEHDTQAFLAAKTLWEWENHDYISKINRVTFGSSLQENTLPI